LRFNDNQPQHLIEAAKSRPSTVILVSWAGSMNKPLFMYKRSHGMNGEDMVYIENKDEEHGYISAGGVRRLPTQKELSSIHTDVQNRICELAIVLPADSQTGVKLVEC